MLLPHYWALYKERPLTTSEKDIKNKEEIKTLLDAAWKPERVAVKRRIPPGSGNRLADKTAKRTAKGVGVTSEAPIKALILAELPELTLDSPNTLKPKSN